MNIVLVETFIRRFEDNWEGDEKEVDPESLTPGEEAFHIEKE